MRGPSLLFLLIISLAPPCVHVLGESSPSLRGRSLSNTCSAPPGSYCGPASTQCPVGSYCPGDGSQYLCSPATACDSIGLSSQMPCTWTLSTLAGGSLTGTFLDGLGTAARFHYPTGVSVDSSFNVYVGDTKNNRVRVVTAGGGVTTLSGSGGPWRVDGTGVGALFK